MRIVGTLVRPLAEQGDRDGHRIDPKGVKLDPATVPLTRNFDKESVLGEATVTLAGNELVATADLNEEGAKAFALGGLRFAIGIVSAKSTLKRAGATVRTSKLMGVALTGEHADPNQPVVEIEP